MPRSAVALLLCIVCAPAAGASAQAATGRLSGRVVDAVDGGGLGAAAVVLSCAEETSRPAAGCVRTAATDAGGRYEFAGLAPGPYRLTVRQPGYRERVIEVVLGGTGSARVSVALEVEPIALEPVWVFASAERTYDAAGADSSASATGAARIGVERRRQRWFLSADVRSLTAADVREAVTLGETDLLRALQRLPGVATRDEWTAELWTRGASWDATSVRFDGFPLYDPLHAFGLLGGVHPDIVGAAEFHPGVQPVSGGAGAALVDIRSRPATASCRGSIELSLASGRASVEDRMLGDRLGVAVALRRTWIDGFMHALSRAFDIDDAEMPYSFWDLAGRVDYALGAGGALEGSVLVERDAIASDLPDVLEGTRAGRGNRVARVTWAAPLRSLDARFTVGGSWFAERIDSAPPVDDDFSAPREAARRTALRHLRFDARVQPRDVAAEPSWSAGASLGVERLAYDGPPPFPAPNYTIAERLDSEHTNVRAAAWASRRLRLGQRVHADVGLRGESLPGAAGAARLGLAPSVTVRWQADSAVFLSAGAGRSFQTVQTAGPLGPWVGETSHWGNFWVLAGADAPLLDARVATVGFEAWLSDAWLASASGYVRVSEGVATQDPRPGDARMRPPFVTGENRARGLELSVRRLSGRATASVGWTWSRSRDRVAGLNFRAAADRPHVIDATFSYRLTGGLSAGAAFTAMSGAPYRRVLTGWLACGGRSPCDEAAVILEAGGARRGSDYASMDVSLDWSGRAFGARAGLFLQVRNALARDNDGAYRVTDQDCTVRACSEADPGPPVDLFAPGLPIVPLIGFRVAF